MPLPEDGAALEELVAKTSRDVLPYAMGNGHPAFFGWVNPPPSFAGVIASLAAAAMNPSVVTGDHADVHLERAVVRWLAELVGFPHEPGAGLLASGGSAATIVCLAGARSRAMAAAGHDCVATVWPVPRSSSRTCRRRRTAACGGRGSSSASAAARSGRLR